MPSVGAECLSAVTNLLSHYKGAPLSIDQRESSVVIKPTVPDSFEVTVYDQGEDAMISAERWHSHYDDPEQAAWCVLWLLTPFYRIVHEIKGGVLVAGWLERYEETGWEAFDPVYFLPPEAAETWVAAPGETFARRYIQQAVLPPPAPYQQFCPGAELTEEGLPPDFTPGARVVEVSEPLGPHLA